MPNRRCACFAACHVYLLPLSCCGEVYNQKELEEVLISKSCELVAQVEDACFSSLGGHKSLDLILTGL
jgi:hypothetical protein